MDDKAEKKEKLAKTIEESRRSLGQTDDINEVIHTARLLFVNLSYTENPSTYVDMHAACLPFFEDIIKKLKKTINKDQELARRAYRVAQKENTVVSRLYVTLAIGFASLNEELLDVVSCDLNGCCHPLRGLVLRHTAIQFYPRESKTLLGFAIDNLSEMIPLYEAFLYEHQDWVELVIDWMLDNVAIVLMLAPDDVNIRYRCLIGASGRFLERLVEMLVTKSSCEILLRISDVVAHKISEEKLDKLALHYCKALRSPSNAFAFIKKTTFASDVSSYIVSLAIEVHDIETMTLCVHQWPTSENIRLVMDTVDPVDFSEMIDTFEEGDPCFVEFLLKRVRIGSTTLRKLLRNSMEHRSGELERALLSYIISMNYGHTELVEIFSYPFVFTDEDLLKYVVFHVEPQEAMQILCQPSQIRTDLIATLISYVADPSEFSTILLICQTVKNITPIISKLSRFNPSVEQIEEFSKLLEYHSDIVLFATVVSSMGFIKEGLRILTTLPSELQTHFEVLDVFGAILGHESSDNGLILEQISKIETTFNLVSQTPFLVELPTQLTSNRKVICVLMQNPVFAFCWERLQSLKGQIDGQLTSLNVRI